LLITAAIRAGHPSDCAARTTASMLLPRPEMRITIFFIARIVPQAQSAAGRPRPGTNHVAARAPPGRLRRSKNAERDFLFGPEFGRVAEHVEQGLARFLVEFLGIRQLLEHDEEAGLGTGLGMVLVRQLRRASKFLLQGLGK
jgi:hypothetical protein